MKRLHARWMAAMALLLVGCGKQPAGGPPPGMAVQVRAAVAAAETVDETISLVGTVAANETVQMRSEIDGRIAEIHFSEGQQVSQGHVLIRLHRDKLAAAAAQAEATYAMAEANRERSESMFANQTISQQEYDQWRTQHDAAKANLDLVREQLADCEIAAPFAGTTGARLVSPGQVISRDHVLTTLVDLETVKVEFQVPERFVGQLAVGQKVAYRVAAYPDERFAGDVYFIDPQVDQGTRTVLVKARADNRDHRLRPGMFGNVDLIVRTKPDALFIPESALIPRGDTLMVMVIDAESKAQPRPVKVGLRLPGRVEILEGLQAGEMVVTEGTQKARPGALLKIAEDPPAPGAPAAPDKATAS